MAIDVSKIGKVTGILLLIVGLYLVVKQDKAMKNSLKQNAYITIGYLERRASYNVKANGVPFSFSYKFHDKKYSSYSSDYAFVNNVDWSNELVGKFYPVIVDSTYPKRATILMTIDDFYEYGIDYPDSLNWVSNYLK